MQRFRPPRILVVEDNLDDIEITRRAFAKSNATSDVTVVRDGQEALDLLLAGPSRENAGGGARPDLILLDINLPKVNGFEVLQRLRASDKTRRIPIVMLTASVRDEDVARSYELGANSYIQKPLAFDEFLRVLGALAQYWFEVVTLPRVD